MFSKQQFYLRNKCLTWVKTNYICIDEHTDISTILLYSASVISPTGRTPQPHNRFLTTNTSYTHNTEWQSHVLQNPLKTWDEDNHFRPTWQHSELWTLPHFPTMMQTSNTIGGKDQLQNGEMSKLGSVLSWRPLRVLCYTLIDFWSEKAWDIVSK